MYERNCVSATSLKKELLLVSLLAPKKGVRKPLIYYEYCSMNSTVGKLRVQLRNAAKQEKEGLICTQNLKIRYLCHTVSKG